MLHSIILPHSGVCGIHYTFGHFISLTSSKVLLILLTLLAVFIQITFIGLILPYPIHFDTKYFKLIYHIIQKDNASASSPIIPTT